METLKKIYLFILDTLQTFVLAASIFLIIYMFLFRPFQVSGISMYPTFQDKEYILTSLISLKFDNNPHKGDVIVFKAPTDSEKDFIKRVIAIGGDTVELKNGFVYVNGTKVNEYYLPKETRTYGGSYLKEDEAVTVSPDEFFVMGDNRMNSSDSREWGQLKKKDIIGISVFVYWPPNHARLVTNPFTSAEKK